MSSVPKNFTVIKDPMDIAIKLLEPSDSAAWDTYVRNHPDGTLFHLSKWKTVIEKTYRHRAYYLVATEDRSQRSEAGGLSWDQNKRGNKYSIFNIQYSITGILPLFHLKSLLFGNNLISMPYFDMGGILADNEEVEKALLSEALKIGRQLRADIIELRHTKALSCLADSSVLIADSQKNNNVLPPINYATKSHKVRMLLKLPQSSETLLQSFKSKLRSQIKKPMKEGLVSKIGGVELLDDFYKVFIANMRDLGSPVHSKKLIYNVLEAFSDNARIIIIYKENTPLACSLVAGFNNILQNPWASALRKYSRLAPNMLLYWSMLEYACDNGYRYFDFGRSTPDEGTYKFKAQWGSKPAALAWQFISLNGRKVDSASDERSKFDAAVAFWQKLPVCITKIIGPPVRKNIGL